MKISTKGRYALRIMLELAFAQEKYMSIKEIASRQGVSEKYAEQIVNQLSKAGMVRSTRGSRGGYMLIQTPEEYTVGSILRQLEGSLAPVACLEEQETPCERKDQCVTIEVWKRVFEAVNGVVDSITLGDLKEWRIQKESDMVS